MNNIRYQVSVGSLHAQLLDIKLQIPSPDLQGQILSLPAWIPGSYMIRDFAKNIVEISAHNSNKQPLKIRKLDKQRWQVEACDGPIELSYSVYANDLSVRSAFVCDEYVFFNGTSVFMQVEGQESQCHEVHLIRPEKSIDTKWRVATTMQEVGNPLYEFGQFRAQDYGELVDHPVLIGDFDLLTFHESGVDFELLLAGGHRTDLKRIEKDLRKICAHHISLFGYPAPVKRYLFQTMLSKNGYGGLEHRSSTALLFSRDDLPAVGEQSISEGYQNFLSLCSHELFHTWHVKRIKPIELHNAKLDQEVYTEQLWIYEGFTSFYDDISLLKAGLVSSEQYLRVLGENLTRFARNSGKSKQTITESSFYAWTKFYQQDASAINNIVSYYLKGGIIAMCLDLLIRQQSEHRLSMDDVMRALWTDYGQTQLPTPPDCIHHILKDIQIDLTDFLHAALQTTEDLPIEELLNSAGIKVNYRSRTEPSDKGGKASPNESEIHFGAMVAAMDTGVKITQIMDNSPARQAGLMLGDQLITVNGWQVCAKSIQTVLDELRDSDVFDLHLLRDGKLKVLSMPKMQKVKDTVYLEVIDESKLQQWIMPT